jgi:MtN3 and saliva related transmembrane protein
MDLTTLLGFIGAFFTTVCNIPQAVKMIKTKETKDVSAPTYIVLFIGLCIWVVYGIMKNDWPIIVANAVSALICATILYLKMSSKKVLDKIQTNIKGVGK